MRSHTIFAGMSLLLLAVPVAAGAAVVTYDIVPAENQAMHEITVTPGAPINVVLTARVDPGDPANPDTDGLSLVNAGVASDLGTPLSPFTLDPGFQAVFPLFASGGKVEGNAITEIGGAQNTFTVSSIKRGVGLAEALTIATGTLQAPTAEGTYTVRTVGSTTNVLTAGTAQSVFPVTNIVNNTLTVQVSAGGGGGGGPTPAPVSFCGLGVAEAALLCLLGLCAARQVSLQQN